MEKGKVIRLPLSNERNFRSETEEKQLDLFGQNEVGYPRIAVIEPSIYNEDEFLAAIRRYNITLIIDMRARPIFDRPNYSHKRITSYFFKRKIKYIDVVHLVHSAKADLQEIERKLTEEFRVNEASSDFFGLCLVDQQAREDGVVSNFRSELRRQPSRVVEVHPRAIGL